MYKIFINQTAVYLSEKANWENKNGLFTTIVSDDIIDVKDDWNFRRFYRNVNQASKPSTIVLLFANQLKMDVLFFDYFTRIQAAGGLVVNAQEEILFIFRLGKWDLPKGKIDIRESPESAAIREVKEETGIVDLKMLKPIPMIHKNCTYHSYSVNSKIILKPTYWYLMFGSSRNKLIPQAIEDITKVEWIGQGQLKEILGNTYPSIIDVVRAGMSFQ
jgi:8-oxo-dGTP pyrophosphatase MutT (NUDIX family)